MAGGAFVIIRSLTMCPVEEDKPTDVLDSTHDCSSAHVEGHCQLQISYLSTGLFNYRSGRSIRSDFL